MADYKAIWEDQEALAQNRERLLSRLNTKLQGYETRYGFNSSCVQAELSAGRLRESADVAEWVVAFDAYRMLTNGNHT